MTNDQLPQCPKCLRLRRLSASRWMFPRGRGQHTRFGRIYRILYNHDHQYHQLVSIHLVTVLCVTWMIFSAVLIQYHCSVLLRGSDVCEKYTGKASADGQGPQWLDGWNAESKSWCWKILDKSHSSSGQSSKKMQSAVQTEMIHSPKLEV